MSQSSADDHGGKPSSQAHAESERRPALSICPQCGAWTRNQGICDDCGAPLMPFRMGVQRARPTDNRPPQPPSPDRPAAGRNQAPDAFENVRADAPTPPPFPSGRPDTPGSEVLELLGESDASDSRRLERQLVGRIMGGCRVESLVGAGGMGAVFRAHHLGLDRPVALKVLPQHLASDNGMVDRFVLEARSVARIEHPNLVHVYDIRAEEDLYYIVMQFVDGYDACQLMMKEGPLEPQRALDIIIQTARALVAIHDEGVIHRDLKPTNILISRQGQVKITDLGLVKLLSNHPDPEPSSDAPRRVPGQTMMSTRIGTPAYMAPEQAEPGQMVDARADIYALGATFFHLLTGRPPFEGETTQEIMDKQRLGPVPNPRSINPWVPTRICQVIGRMMARAPDDRYPSARELITDLESIARFGLGQQAPSLGYSLSRAAIKLNSFLVSIVLEQKLATGEQIEDCLRLQTEMVALGSPRSLGEIFLERGLLVDDQMAAALKAFTGSEVQRHNSLFGRIAMGAGLLTRQGLREGLKLQRAMVREGRKPVRLGELLVQYGFLTAEKVDVILRAQENYVRTLDDSFFEQAAEQAGIDRERIKDAVRSLHATGDDPRSLLQFLLEREKMTAQQAQELMAEQCRRLITVMVEAGPQGSIVSPPTAQEQALSTALDSGEWSADRLREIASLLPAVGESDPAPETVEVQPGPWGWLSPGSENADLVSLRTLAAWVEQGRIGMESMVRGPTTGGRWTFASHTPGLSKHLGCCPHCEARVQPTAEVCGSCSRYVDWPANMTVSLPGPSPSGASSRPTGEWTNG